MWLCLNCGKDQYNYCKSIAIIITMLYVANIHCLDAIRQYFPVKIMRCTVGEFCDQIKCLRKA